MPRKRGNATPRDADWIRHKSLIRKRYIIDRVSPTDLSRELEELGFSVTPKQLEHQLARWGFRRKVTEAGWRYIDHQFTKREAEGKDSAVFLCGRELETKTVRKERSRHITPSILPTIDGPPPRTPPDLTLSVCTPPPIRLEVAWSPNLPWLSFERMFSTLFVPGFAQNPDTNAWALPVDIFDGFSQDDTNAITIHQTSLSAKGPNTSIVRFASALKRYMPESYSGEHLNRAETILRGTIEEVYQESARLLIFRMSNSLNYKLTDSQWKFLLDFLQRSRILESPLGLASPTHPTIGGFAEALFRVAVIRHLKSGGPSGDQRLRNEAWAVIEWLVSSGFDFSEVLLPDSNGKNHPVLHLPIQFRDYELAASFIRGGADINPTGRLPPLQLLIHNLSTKSEDWERQSITRLIQSMLASGARLDNSENPTWPSPLMMAISTGDFDLIDTLIQHGGNTLALRQVDDIFREADSVLGRCARYPDEETALRLLGKIFGILDQQPPDPQTLQRIMISAIMDAAANGHARVIKHLLVRLAVPITDIQIANGATPLHTASFHGHLEICGVLLECGHPPDTASLAGLSPLHFACLHGNLPIVRFLIHHGADIERACVVQSHELLSGASWVDLCGLEGVTPLAASLKGCVSQYRWSQECAIALIEAGAHPHAEALLIGVQQSNGRLFDSLLAGGADPNAKAEESGHTVLWHLLEFQHKLVFSAPYKSEPLPEVEMARRANALLAHGAKPTGGELMIAIQLGNLDLIRRMVASGASCSDTGHHGERATEAALQSQNLDLAQVLDPLSPGHLYKYDAGVLCAAVKAALVLRENRRWSWVETILRRRPLCASPDLMEGTALAFAICYNDYNMMELLLQFIPTPNLAILPLRLVPFKDWSRNRWVRWVDDEGVLIHAFEEKFFWRTKKCCVTGSPVTTAVTLGDVRLVEWLLGHGLVVDRLALATAAAKGSLPLVKILVAAVQNTLEYVGLPEHRARRNYPHSDNPFYWAIFSRNSEILRLVRSVAGTGSDPYVDCPGGRSNLQTAVELGEWEAMKLLIDDGADINEPPATFVGATSLQLAAMKGYLGIAKYLIDLGANLNAAGSEECGRTALEGAAEHGRIDMIRLLLDECVKTTGKGRRWYLQAVILAEMEGHGAAARMLRSHREWTKVDEEVVAILEMEDDWDKLEESDMPDED